MYELEDNELGCILWNGDEERIFYRWMADFASDEFIYKWLRYGNWSTKVIDNES